MREVMRFEMLAKMGYAARGIVFLLVAALALFSGIAGGQPETKTAISTVLHQPLGRVWVGLIGLGLLGFATWRLAQSIADADGQGNDGKAMIIRAALLGSAVTYTGLAVYALGHAVSASGDSGGSGEKGLAEWVMSQPFGSYIAIAIGVGLIAGGIVTAVKGAFRKFEKYVHFPDRSGVLSYICMYGLVARGAVFSVTGILFTYAGIKVDPDQAGGIAEALEWLRELPFGSVLYVAIAIGLAAFGVYNLIAAKYRTVKGPRLDDVKRAISLNLRR